MKKIGEIKGVPVVEGDANLVKDQILYKETDEGISLLKRTSGKLEEVSGGNSSSSNIKYYDVINWTGGTGANTEMEFAVLTLADTARFTADEYNPFTTICSTGFACLNDFKDRIQSVRIDFNKRVSIKIDANTELRSVNEVISFYRNNGTDIFKILEEISEEDFYSVS